MKIKSKNYKYKSSKSRLSGKNKRQKNASAHLFNHHVGHMLKWLIKTYGFDSSLYTKGLPFMDFINHIGKFKGQRAAINYIKQARLSVTRYLSKQPLGCSEVVKLTYDGLPVRLMDLIPYIRVGNVPELRYILTLLYSLRRITLPPEPDLETVTSKSTATDLSFTIAAIPKFTKALSKLKGTREFRKSKLVVKDWDEYHLSTKSGPTGQALLTSLGDLANLPEILRINIAKIGGTKLKDNMELCLLNIGTLKELLELPSVNKTTFRRLTSFKDSEGKTRLIAIGDY